VRIKRLRRYPVKSMLGEELVAADVWPDGIDGDRALALIHDETGKVASAKNPRLWRAMLAFTAVGYPDVTITGPDGAPVKDLGEALGQQVTLSDTRPEGATLDRSRPDEVLRDGITAITNADVVTLTGRRFHDFAALHLITTATLDAVGGQEPERYRPNIVIETPDQAGFPENDWLGHELRLGAGLVVRVIARTPRCAIPTLAHGDLPRNTDALRVPAARNRVKPMPDMDAQPCAGVYAQVVTPGRITVGDQVTRIDPHDHSSLVRPRPSEGVRLARFVLSFLESVRRKCHHGDTSYGHLIDLQSRVMRQPLNTH
jgi:uncharacterized protein YcbX